MAEDAAWPYARDGDDALSWVRDEDDDVIDGAPGLWRITIPR